MTKHSLTFSIPQPCSESWLNMSKEEKGNFCHNCQKVVIDFSRMSDDDIIRAIKNTKGSVCGRFSNTQLNRPMYFSYSANVQRPFPLKIILTGIIALTLIQPVVSEATTHYPEHQQLIYKETSVSLKMLTDTSITSDTLKGVVVAEHLRVPLFRNAKVYIEGSRDSATVDESGRFAIAVPPQHAGKSFMIEIILSERTKSYFQVSPEDLSSSKEQVFVISNEKYSVDGMVVYDENAAPEPEVIEHTEIKKGKKK